MKSSIKFAILGCGHIGKRHAQMVIKNNSCELVALCDVLPKKELQLNEFGEVPFYNSIDELIKSNTKIDVVCVCTPNGQHANQSIQLLKNSFHVVCEKPMALTSKECEAIIKTSNEVSKHVFCVMQNRYSSPSKWLKEVISKKLLGDIFIVQVNCFWNRDERYYKNSSWRGTLNLDGGTLFTQFSHYIDTIYWILGNIRIDSAEFRDFNHSTITEFEDTGVVNFTLDQGGIGTLNYSTSVWNENLESSLTIIAENGSIKIGGQYMDKVVECVVKNYKMPKLAPVNNSNNYGSYKGSAANHQYVIENVVNTLKGYDKMTTEPIEGMKVVEIIEKIYELKKSRNDC
jgi:predicted dehydrogenase